MLVRVKYQTGDVKTLMEVISIVSYDLNSAIISYVVNGHVKTAVIDLNQCDLEIV